MLAIYIDLKKKCFLLPILFMPRYTYQKIKENGRTLINL